MISWTVNGERDHLPIIIIMFPWFLICQKENQTVYCHTRSDCHLSERDFELYVSQSYLAPGTVERDKTEWTLSLPDSDFTGTDTMIKVHLGRSDQNRLSKSSVYMKLAYHKLGLSV